jgi:hypothetical protein
MPGRISVGRRRRQARTGANKKDAVGRGCPVRAPSGWLARSGRVVLGFHAAGLPIRTLSGPACGQDGRTPDGTAISRAISGLHPPRPEARKAALGQPGRCCSSVVEHSLGKGEVESSIPSSSTIQCSLAEPASFASTSQIQPPSRPVDRYRFVALQHPWWRTQKLVTRPAIFGQPVC